jgi:hypothetical protein
MQLGRDYDAISDFSSAIKLRPRELNEHYSYENRADAYVKTRQWDRAIGDLTAAISLQVGGHLMSFMTISEFRAIYPEYKMVSDEVIARKLHQTFWPNLSYEGFSKYFVHGRNSLANYDASGDLVGSREGSRWASIIPDTVAETLYSGACRTN